MTVRNNRCPVCGFALGFEPWSGSSPSHEICPSCGIQFGYDDMAGGDPGRRAAVYESWRTRWLERGAPWVSAGTKKPEGWNPLVQMRRMGVTVNVLFEDK